MDEHKGKRDSLFSGIFPPDEHDMPPAPAPQPPKPAVTEDQLSALNKRLELMERNIVGQLEKGNPEPAQLPAAPPAPELIVKMTEIEARFREFQEKYMLGAAQIKNIEESKISARREIEELLKAVREQQKYSELDRQMRDQLEKAWARVEEMEKRLLEVYSAAASRPAAPAPDARAGGPALAALGALGTDLEDRLKMMEASIKNLGGQAGQVSAALLGLDARLSGLSGELNAKLAAVLSSCGPRPAEVLPEFKAELLSAAREILGEINGALARQGNVPAPSGEESLQKVLKPVNLRLDELAAAQKLQNVRIEALEAGIENGAGTVREALGALRDELGQAVAGRVDGLAADLRRGRSGLPGDIKESAAYTASDVAAMAVLSEVISGTEQSLSRIAAALNAFTSALAPVNLDGLRGVSGVILRGSLETVAALAGELGDGRVKLARAGAVIRENLSRVLPGQEDKK